MSSRWSLFAFPVGFLVAGGATIELAYESGGFNVLGGGSGIVDSIGRLLSNPTVPKRRQVGRLVVRRF